MLVAGVLISLSVALTCRSVEFNRTYTWWAFSKAGTLVSLAAIFVAFSAVSVAAILVARGATGMDLSLAGASSAMVSAQAAARRMRSCDRGGTLVLGLISLLLEATDAWVVDRIEQRCLNMSDEELLNASDRADARTFESLKTSKAIKSVAALRAAHDSVLRHNSEHKRAAARAVLSRRVAEPWMRYRMGPFT